MRAAPRRTRVERNIYQRATGVYELGFRDLDGVQRWVTIGRSLDEAREQRDMALALRRARKPRRRVADVLGFGTPKPWE